MTREPVLYVLAGVNGSGKSSIGGAAFEVRGVDYYNPDSAAQKLLEMYPGMTQPMANSHAWTLGREMLEKAIARRKTYEQKRILR